MVRSFKDLVVWQKSFTLVEEIYMLSKKLPKDEQFGLVSQIRRAAVSIPSNIAEGSRRNSRKEYIQFLKVAEGSSLEVETQLLILEKVYNMNVSKTLVLTAEVQKMLFTMIKKLNPSP